MTVRGPVETLSHPDLEDPALLLRIADRLRDRLHATRVIVYGSVARGEATIHSDIDLLVVAPSADWPPHARRDWSRTVLLLREHNPEGAGIHLQQAVEKYLKGWLLDRGWALRRAREVDRLVDDATSFVPHLRTYRPLCVRLSAYYLVERYPPTALSGPTEARLRTDLAEALQLVLTRFPGEAV